MRARDGVPATGLLIALTTANGAAVSTLYWGQAMVGRAVEDFGPSATISLMPGATLAGYALGVAGLAAFGGDLTDPKALARHFGLLVAALCAAAAAPNSPALTAACLLVGIGCALTQRLLASATSAVPADARPQTIGWIIAGGLLGIVLARGCIPAAAQLAGWRAVFWADAGLICAGGIAAVRAARHAGGRVKPQRPAPLSSAVSLWRQQPALRQAALQQALVFALFNAGWAIFPRVLFNAGIQTSIAMAAVALLGAGTALVSGWLCGRWTPATVARAGVAAVSIASVALILGFHQPPWFLAGMGLLDAGTQAALVANQARAQALATSPAMRGRLAAIVTTVGFMGGAVGSAVGNLVVWSGLALGS